MIFRKSTRMGSLPFGFLCAKTTFAFLLNGKEVMMSFFCNFVNSTVMSYFKLIGVRWF